MGRVCHGPSLSWAEMSRNPTELRGVQPVANSSASSIFHISFD